MSDMKNIPRLPTRNFRDGDWVEWETDGQTFEGWIVDTIGIDYVAGQREYECVIRISRDELKSVRSGKLTFVDDNSVSGIMNRLRPLNNSAGPTVTSYSQRPKTGLSDLLRR